MIHDKMYKQIHGKINFSLHEKLPQFHEKSEPGHHFLKKVAL